MAIPLKSTSLCPGAVMKNGRIVEVGDVVQICENPQHEYTQSLIGAVPRPDPRLRADAPQ